MAQCYTDDILLDIFIIIIILRITATDKIKL